MRKIIWDVTIIIIIISFTTTSLLLMQDTTAFGLASGTTFANDMVYSSGTILNQNSAFDRFLFGIGPEQWNNLNSVNAQYDSNMTLATSWINTQSDLYGWWNSSFFPASLWNKGQIPHIITWSYFTNTWNVDYSSANLTIYKQSWLEDLRFMANRLKGPSDGKHVALVSLETEFNSYPNINYTYWNQLMIESREVIKQVAPNVLVSYSFGGWVWRWGDITEKGALTQSMQAMDFLSFQCMWGAYGNDQTRWINGDQLKTNYQGINWAKTFGNKTNIWDYIVDDIIGNIKTLSSYNTHILLDHLSIDSHLWGVNAQTDAVTEISNNIGLLKSMGLFGISWMRFQDSKWENSTYWPGDIGSATGGMVFPDGTTKPCFQIWASMVSLNH